MSSTIFILGAGASRAAGAPLMSDFLDVAHERWKLGLPKPDDSAYATVFKAISKLQQVHSKAHLQITKPGQRGRIFTFDILMERKSRW